MRQGPFRLRATALLSVGVLMVHELRYRLAFDGHADHAVEAHGHSHLSVVAPLVGLLVLVAGAHLLQQVARGGTVGPRRSLTGLWLLATAALAAAFSAQELLEGALAPGHPAGVDGVFGSGGWIAGPLAMLVGGAVALLLRGADTAVAAGARLSAGVVRVVAPAESSTSAPVVRFSAPRSPLATLAAGRAPPHVCV